jgi:hypothetical protein
VRGTFEAHLTVDAEGTRREAFRALCESLGVKCVLIELARGAHRSQPMTSSHHTGELPAVKREIEALRIQIEAAGFPVTRTKIEADVTNEGVDAAGEPGTYFEFHAKLQLPADADLEALRARCEQHGAHLSRNEIERGARFVTLRVHDAGRDAATAAFARVLESLAGYRIAATKAELTLYDSRVELDAGWL